MPRLRHAEAAAAAHQIAPATGLDGRLHMSRVIALKYFHAAGHFDLRDDFSCNAK
jgi:hypothetical protein